MVGLGVLRRAGPDLTRYALRSPAIAGLLGSPVEIEQALLEASEKAPPELYQADTYRRGRPGDPWVRSPLTGQQERVACAEQMTGWWGEPLASLGERLEADPAAWRNTFEAFRREFAETLYEMVVKDVPPELVHPLAVLASYGEPLPEEDWLELLEGPDAATKRSTLRRIIRWADLLSLLAPSGVDPVSWRP